MKEGKQKQTKKNCSVAMVCTVIQYLYIFLIYVRIRHFFKWHDIIPSWAPNRANIVLYAPVPPCIHNTSLKKEEREKTEEEKIHLIYQFLCSFKCFFLTFKKIKLNNISIYKRRVIFFSVFFLIK